MAANKKGSRKIIVEGIEFRWNVTGNDECITIVIWADRTDSLKLFGNLEYHNEFKQTSFGKSYCQAATSQIIVTNRVIRKVIEHVGIEKILNTKGQFNLGHIEIIYDINNALRMQYK